MTDSRPTASPFRFAAATPARWADVEKLFGPRGACAGCWCMWARLPSAEFARGKGDGNRRALRRLVEHGERPGIIAYRGGEPVGWCALAPRRTYVRLEKSRVLAPVDERPTWSVVCFFVSRECRGQGLTVELLRQAALEAKRRGATLIEGYPTDTKGAKSAAAFVWTGIATAFERAGFEEVARRSPTRPIMRLALGRGATGAGAPARRAGAAAPRVRAGRARASGRAAASRGRAGAPAKRPRG